MDALAAVDSGGDSQDLYRDHTGPLLERLAASQHDWTVHSAELQQFNVLVTHAGEPPRNVPRPGLGPPAPRRAEVFGMSQGAAD